MLIFQFPKFVERKKAKITKFFSKILKILQVYFQFPILAWKWKWLQSVPQNSAIALGWVFWSTSNLLQMKEDLKISTLMLSAAPLGTFIVHKI